MTVSHTIRNGICHIFAIVISIGILLSFGLLTKYPIYVPHYATEHKVADAQQVVNLLVIVAAACLVLFMRYCFRYFVDMPHNVLTLTL